MIGESYICLERGPKCKTLLMDFVYASSFAARLDQNDALAEYRDQFHIPNVQGKPSLYFTGNSLGLQPKGVRQAFLDELDDWAEFGVEGHFHARKPWYSYHELFADGAAKLLGAKPSEVVMMNGLTVNIHLLMVSFYQPKGRRTKILCEKKAFPSDQYAIETQIRFHGGDPEHDVIEIGPRQGEHLIREEDILQAIEDNKDELALVFIGAVNYYSGQWFNLQKITRAAHGVGALCGFDLAHAAGNMPMQLHAWDIDFACWCTYKYLNSGPGSVAGAFVHERHCSNTDLIRFGGWWGYDKQTRFQMKPGFQPIAGAEGWQLSNAPVMNMVAHKVSLDMFTKVGMAALRKKTLLMTSYLEYVVSEVSKSQDQTRFEVITPSNPEERGAQLSILAHGSGKELFDALTAAGVIADWREPNVIRVAPVPMYNSFTDCYNFGQQLESALKGV